MKKNLARRKLLDGGLISGISLLYPSPEIAEEVERFGFDFVVFDWQHGPWSETTLNSAIALYTHSDTTAIVRLPGPDPVWIGKMLDLGALGIIVPMTETAAQCEAIVQAAKFPPQGRRSATGLRNAYYAGGDAIAYVEAANEEILVVVMVETTVGVENVREIMGVPGVDCVLIGPYDLTRSAGARMPDDAKVESLVQRVVAAAQETGVAAGYYTNAPMEAASRAAEGFRLVFLGHDMVLLPEALADLKEKATQLQQAGAGP